MVGYLSVEFVLVGSIELLVSIMLLLMLVNCHVVCFLLAFF